MRTLLPGTTLPLPAGAEIDAFGALEPVFAISGGGLLLSQVAEMTGLEPTTIQNWVKRGWVSNPVNKKYDTFQVARILLINLLRPAMRLEDIVRLLQYINGRVDDRTDDIIPEPQLYSLLCRCILQIQETPQTGPDELSALVQDQLRHYRGPVPDAPQRLSCALSIMLLNVLAALLMQRANRLFETEVTAAAPT